MMVSLSEEEIRRLLEEERTRLRQIRMSLAMDETESGFDDPMQGELSSVDQHDADRGTETFERERDLSILEHVDAQLSDVDRAVDRLREGTYGTCEACGRPIDEDRLRARPAARYCIDDQAKAERRIP